MGKRSYALRAGGRDRINLTWKWNFKDVRIALNGKTVGYFPNRRAIEIGKEFLLPDNSTLMVQYYRPLFVRELRVLRNGKPLPGSDSHPAIKIRNACRWIYVVAGVNILIGLWEILFRDETFIQLGTGVFAIFFGLVFLVLGFITQKKNSLLALILAIIILAVDGILGAYISITNGYGIPYSGLSMRFIIMLPMFRGANAFKSLNSENA